MVTDGVVTPVIFPGCRVEDDMKLTTAELMKVASSTIPTHLGADAKPEWVRAPTNFECRLLCSIHCTQKREDGLR